MLPRQKIGLQQPDLRGSVCSEISRPEGTGQTQVGFPEPLQLVVEEINQSI